MSNKNNSTKFECPVNKFDVLLDILHSIEDASRVSPLAIDTIDVALGYAVITGDNLGVLVFPLAVYGYSITSSATHLFMEEV